MTSVIQPHVQLRNALLDDHVKKGWMDADMFLAYCLMLRHCDWDYEWLICADGDVIYAPKDRVNYDTYGDDGYPIFPALSDFRQALRDIE